MSVKKKLMAIGLGVALTLGISGQTKAEKPKQSKAPYAIVVGSELILDRPDRKPGDTGVYKFYLKGKDNKYKYLKLEDEKFNAEVDLDDSFYQVLKKGKYAVTVTNKGKTESKRTYFTAKHEFANGKKENRIPHISKPYAKGDGINESITTRLHSSFDKQMVIPITLKWETFKQKTTKVRQYTVDKNGKIKYRASKTTKVVRSSETKLKDYSTFKRIKGNRWYLFTYEKNGKETPYFFVRLSPDLKTIEEVMHGDRFK